MLKNQTARAAKFPRNVEKSETKVPKIWTTSEPETQNREKTNNIEKAKKRIDGSQKRKCDRGPNYDPHLYANCGKKPKRP